ncbi:hypothetical protein A9Z06_17195 [Rhizobium sp. YK2]|nr:hypothetical protein A9Z06_17195 [Rhizobium sp. YK2]
MVNALERTWMIGCVVLLPMLFPFAFTGMVLLQRLDARKPEFMRQMRASPIGRFLLIEELLERPSDQP